MFDQAALEGMAPEDMQQMSDAAQGAIDPAMMEQAQGAQAPMDPMMAQYDQARMAAPMVDTGADNYTAGLESNEANPMAGLI